MPHQTRIRLLLLALTLAAGALACGRDSPSRPVRPAEPVCKAGQLLYRESCLAECPKGSVADPKGERCLEGCRHARTLRQAGECTGKLVGAMVQYEPLAREADYRQVAAREYRYLSGADMVWKYAEKERGVWNLANSRPLMDFAEANGARVMWHNLVWYLDKPDWVTERMPAEELEQAVEAAVRKRVNLYRGRVHAWITVNEALGDDGSPIEHLYYQKLGPDYVDKTFRLVHELDPGALLLLNDHSMDVVNAKSDGARRFLRGMLERRVPVQAVGLQSHVNALHPPARESIQENIRKFGELGLQVFVTELDVRIGELGGTVEEKLAAQGRIYHDFGAACASEPACAGIISWGFTDRHSWIDQYFAPDDALLFDEKLQPKPAYEGLLRGLTGQPLQDNAGSELPLAEKGGECRADCASRECGDDGCGGCCGLCDRGKVCAEGRCVPAPTCPKPPKGWPPRLDDLYADGRCRLPSCDPDAPVCWDAGCPGNWEAVLRTTATDCSTAVGWYDARGKVGNLKTETQYFGVEGTCLENRRGEVTGAIYDGVLASCQATEQGMGVTAFETGIVDLKQGGKGKARVPLIHIPRFVAFGSGSCVIELEVQLRRAKTGK